MDEQAKPHLLLVDDDDRLRALLKRFLRAEGYVISTAASAKEAREIMALFAIDLMVLDVMMPCETGVEFARSLQGISAPPILMLSALSETQDRVNGLEAGVDDYLAKPFEPQELGLRIKAILRRNISVKVDAERLAFGEYIFDRKANRLLKKGEPVALTTTEAALLKALCEYPSKAVAREDLAKLCGIANARAVDVQIARLRKKIESTESKPVYIQTVRGAGYGLFGVGA